MRAVQIGSNLDHSLTKSGQVDVTERIILAYVGSLSAILVREPHFRTNVRWRIPPHI